MRIQLLKRFLVLAFIATSLHCLPYPPGYPRQSTRAREMSNALSNAATAADGVTVHLKDLTDFEWDTVHLYAPYTCYGDITAQHQDELCGVSPKRYVPDDWYVLIFLLHSQVVEVVLHSGDRGSFADITGTFTGHAVYTRDDAVFEVDRRGPDGWRPYFIELGADGSQPAHAPDGLDRR